jgi:hypothetical protein
MFRLSIGLAASAAFAAWLAAAGVAAESPRAMAAEADSILGAWRRLPFGLELKTVGKTAADSRAERTVLTLPTLNLSIAGRALRIVGAKLTLTPHDDDRTRVELTLPNSAAVLGADGTPRGRSTLQGQRISGLWDRRVQGFVHVDLRLDGLRAAEADGRQWFAVRTASLLIDTVETASGRWDGGASLEIGDFRIADGERPLSAATISLAVRTRGLELARRYADRSARGLDWRLGPDPGGVPAPDLWSYAETFGAALDAHGMGATGRAPWSVDHLRLSVAGSKASAVALDGEARGLGIPYALQHFVPSEISLKATLPRPTSAEFGGILEVAVGTGPQAALVGLLSTLPAPIEIDRAKARNAALAAEGAGLVHARPDGKGATAAVGQGQVAVTGLGPAIDELVRRPDHPQGRTALALLVALRGLGRPRPGAESGTADYAIVATPDGKLTVNGFDLAPLLVLFGHRR